MDEQLRINALEYHRYPTPGKISITPTKALVNQRDLALAYSPGVAYAMPGHRGQSVGGSQSHLARQSGRGCHQRYGCTRPRQHRPAGRRSR